MSEAQDALKLLKTRIQNAPPVQKNIQKTNKNKFSSGVENIVGYQKENFGDMGRFNNNDNNPGYYNKGMDNRLRNNVPPTQKPIAKNPVGNKMNSGMNSNINRKGIQPKRGMMSPFGGTEDNRPLGGNMGNIDYNEGANEPTYPCPDCGRNFRADVLEKHKKICKKVFMKKRKVFNSQKKRMVDSEQMSLMKYGQKNEKKMPKLKKNNWKAQSEEFRSILKANRGLKMPDYGSGMGGFGGMGGMSGMGNMGGGLDRYRGARGNYGSSGYGTGIKNKGKVGMNNAFNQPPQRSVISDSFKLCKFCNRRYNDEAFAKHYPGCERRYKENQIRKKLQKPSKGGR